MTQETTVVLRQEHEFRFAIDFGAGIPFIRTPAGSRPRLRQRSDAMLENLDRVLGQFEWFCTVAQSVGQGVPVEVSVIDAAGERLK